MPAPAGRAVVPSIVSMLSHLAATGSLRQIIAVHADRTQDTLPFRTAFDQFVAKLLDATRPRRHRTLRGVASKAVTGVPPSNCHSAALRGVSMACGRIGRRRGPPDACWIS
jgi:nitric oxide dioxygenase